MIKLSVYIIAYNEEKRIKETLKAASQIADEIVVVDSGSTDNTIQIVKQYHATVFHHQWESYANQKNFAQNQCRHQWLLQLDADEVLSPDLIREIQKIKKEEPQFYAYNLKIAEIFPGMRYHKLTRTYNILRLYHRDFADMRADLLTADRIHLTQKVPIGQLKHPIFHYSILSISQHVQKLNHYTDEVQALIIKKRRRYSVFRLIFEFPRQFLIYYIKHRYFLHGTWGFVAAMNLSYARFLKIAKSIENRRFLCQHR